MAAADPDLRLRGLVPAITRQRAGDCAAVPIELGMLLSAAVAQQRSLLAFAPPLVALAASSAGLFRAARERRASLVLRVDLAGIAGQASAATLAAICQASEDAQYRLPFALLAELAIDAASLESGGAGRDVADAIAAGYPGLVLRVTLPVDVTALLAALTPARDQELGCALAVVAGHEPEDFLGDLREAGAPVAAVLGDREMALSARAYRWARGEPLLWAALLEERPPVIEVPLALPNDARADRAEALAYFAADAALVVWDGEESGPQLRRALLAAGPADQT